MVEDLGAADVIVAIDGEKVSTPAEFLGFIEGKKPGDRVKLTVLRDKRPVDIEIELGGEEAPKGRKPTAE